VTIVFYISGHGFGHASRSVELINALAQRRPEVRVVVRTSVSPAFLETAATGPLEIATGEIDSGVVQLDSLSLDEEDTALRAKRFYDDFDRRSDEEADWLRARRPAIVLGDIPPLAFAAADLAGCPSVAIGNFTWDWIYRGFTAFDRLAPDVIPTIGAAYRLATEALRLPMHGGFDAMSSAPRDIPFIARQSSRDRREIRRMLQIDADRPVVLPSFGAYGASYPREALVASRQLTVLELHQAPAGLSYPDLVAAADVVVSKPGYGIVSECLANRTALLYTSRGRFPEYDVLVEEMPRVLRCRYLAPEDFAAGRWADGVEALLAQSPPPGVARTDGAAVAADAILEMIAGESSSGES
jgi:hypothetical protein